MRGGSWSATVALRIPKRKHPINDLLALLGRRWTLRVLWELRDAPVPYAELRRRCDEVSTSVLAQRLRELRDEGLVELGDAGYALTGEGRRLSAILLELNEFAGGRGRRGSSA